MHAWRACDLLNCAPFNVRVPSGGDKDIAGKSALCRGGYARISAYSKPSNERWLRLDAIILFMGMNRVDTICSSVLRMVLRRGVKSMYAWSMPRSCSADRPSLKAFRLLKREKYDICVLKFNLFPSPMPTRRPTGRMTFDQPTKPAPPTSPSER